MANYDSNEWYDDPVERGNQLLGAPSSWWFTSAYTDATAYTELAKYQTAKNPMTAYCNTTITGLVPGYYTILGVFTLSNSAKVVKLRSQLGSYGTEWTGAYGDADPLWTSTITATSKTSAGYVNAPTDGVFFITTTNFRKYF